MVLEGDTLLLGAKAEADAAIMANATTLFMMEKIKVLSLDLN